MDLNNVMLKIKELLGMDTNPKQKFTQKEITQLLGEAGIRQGQANGFVQRAGLFVVRSVQKVFKALVRAINFFKKKKKPERIILNTVKTFNPSASAVNDFKNAVEGLTSKATQGMAPSLKKKSEALVQ